MSFKTPEALAASWPELSIGDDEVSLDHIVELCKRAIAASPNVSHPHFYNQLFARPDVVGTLGELVSAALNSSM